MTWLVAGDGRRRLAPLADAPKPVTGRISSMTWTGVNGVVFDLIRGDQGIRLLENAVEGLHEPLWEHQTQSRPLTHGEAWQSATARPRDIFWPILIDDTLGDWHRTAERFFQSVSPTTEGTWTVDGPGGEAREIKARLAGEPHTYKHDPYSLGATIMGVKLRASQPFWVGRPDTKTWRPATYNNWLPTASRRGFVLGPDQTLGPTTLANVGDLATAPTWTVHGPCTSINIRIDGQEISGPLVLSAGQTATIDPDGHGGAVRSDGHDLTPLLTKWSAARIPAGGSTDVVVDVGGGGWLQCHVRALYRRAFA